MPEHPDYNLNRFVSAQDPVYEEVLSELRAGRKRSHWMWFIFPQIVGLGLSGMDQRYSIKSEAEAREYLAHPVLGERMRECARLLAALTGGRTALEIFGFPDNLKLRSSLTLFAHASDGEELFTNLLEKYYEREGDLRTIEILKNLAQK